ncbi:MAG TPA: cupin domain-containing protein, partial [Solirubrobacteraceae bacterium]|nr:cupin domain-containing protein [Solirubrobacteraceae bacterium]
LHNQEDFFVLSGECLLLIEGEERKLKAWDFVHCPPGTDHIFIGAGDGPCVLFMVGARGDDAIVYPRSELALRHEAGVEVETPSPNDAYAPHSRWQPGGAEIWKDVQSA